MMLGVQLKPLEIICGEQRQSSLAKSRLSWERVAEGRTTVKRQDPSFWQGCFSNYHIQHWKKCALC